MLEVDEVDFEWAMQWKWCFSHGYAMRKEWLPDRSRKRTLYLHSELAKRIGLKGPMVDHKDTNRLNNRRGNLRAATRAQNVRNQRRGSRNTSGFKGVSYHRQSRKWIAWIGRKDIGKRYLGLFETPQEAHEAYKKAAVELFGEFARFE